MLSNILSLSRESFLIMKTRSTYCTYWGQGVGYEGFIGIGDIKWVSRKNREYFHKIGIF